MSPCTFVICSRALAGAAVDMFLPCIPGGHRNDIMVLQAAAHNPKLTANTDDTSSGGISAMLKAMSPEDVTLVYQTPRAPCSLRPLKSHRAAECAECAQQAHSTYTQIPLVHDSLMLLLKGPICGHPRGSIVKTMI